MHGLFLIHALINTANVYYFRWSLFHYCFEYNAFSTTSTTDIDECTDENAGCDHLCINEYGSYHCQCRDGYTLGPDDHSCFGKRIILSNALNSS